MTEPGGPTFGQAAYAGAPGGGGDYSRAGGVNLSANTSAYQSGMHAAQTATQGVLNVVVELYTKVDQLFKIGGRSLQIVAAADVAMLGHAASNAADLQAQMSTLHATAEINRTSMDAFDKSVDNAFSKFPAHRSDVVALVTEITNLGVKSKDINNVTTSVEKLGAASGENIPQLANGLILLNRQTGGSGATNIAGYANAVLTLSKNAGTSVTGILSFSQAIAPISRLSNISQAAVMGIATAFSKAGADGYYAANTFNSVLNDITIAVRTGSPELTKYASFVGMTADQFRKLPAKEQITDIFDAIARGGPRALNFVNELGLGTRGLTAVQAVAQQGGLRHFIDLSERQSGQHGNLDRGADAALGGLSATAARLHNQFTRLEDQLGAPLLGPLTGLTHGLEMFLGGVNAVTSHLGPLPTLLAALAAPLSLIAGVGLTHASVVGLVAGARLLRGPGTGQAFLAGRQTQMMVRGGMGAEEAMLATGVGAAVAGEGRNLVRTRAAFLAGRGRGMFGATAASAAEAETLAMAGAGAGVGATLNRTGGRVIGSVMRFPTWLLGQQASQIRDSQAPSGLSREAYKGTAEAEGKAAAATTKVATAEERQATIVGSLTRGTWNLVKAFAELGVETARYSVVLAREGVAAAGKGASTAVIGRAASAETLALNRLKTAEMDRAAVTATATRSVAASHQAEAAAVAAAAETETVALTRMQGMRARAFGFVPTGALGKAFGLAMGGQLAGMMIDDGQQGSTRNRAATVTSDALMGAALASFLPFGGFGMLLGAGVGGAFGFGSSMPSRPVVKAPTVSAFRRSTSATGTGSSSFASLTNYLKTKTPLLDAMRRGGDPFSADFTEADFLKQFTGQPEYRDRMLSLLGDETLGPRRVTGDQQQAIRDAIANYQAGVAAGRRDFQQHQAAISHASPLANAITGTDLFHRVAYGDLSGNVGAQNRLIEQTAQTAIQMTGSTGKASAELQKLADAAGGAAGQLLQNSAAYARMIQGFNLGYQSRDQRLGTLTRDAVASRRIAMGPNATDYDKQQAASDQQALAQEKQSYTQYLQSVYVATREFHVSQERAQEDYEVSVFRSNRNFQIQMQQSEHDYLLSRSRQLEDFNISMARSAQSSAEGIYDPFRTVQLEQVASGGMIVANLEDQNRRIMQQRIQLQQLSSAGLSQGAIDTLRLADPKNAQQVDALAQSVLNDPQTIARINRLIATRQQTTTALVQSNFNEDFRNTVADFRRGLSRAATDYNTARDRAKAAQSLALSDMATDFNKMVTRSGEDLTRQMTELYGNFAQNYTRTLGEINKSIGQAVPDLADKLIKQIQIAEGRIADAANSGLDTGGGNPAPPGSAANPIYASGTLGINPRGQIGKYGPAGKFHPYKGYLNPTQAKGLEHIGNPKTARATTPAEAQSYARGLLEAYGWSPDQMSSLTTLWNNESGWDYHAENSSSGAYGIPQALPANKMASAGSDWHDNGATQIRWGLGYIKGRYGSPSAALNFWNNIAPLSGDGSHWYHSGGIFTGKRLIGVGDVAQGEQVLPLDGRGTNFMVAFYDRVTTALMQRLGGGGRGQPGLPGTGTTFVHEDHRNFYTGDIKVEARDPADLERQLAARARMKRLASPARPGP